MRNTGLRLVISLKSAIAYHTIEGFSYFEGFFTMVLSLVQKPLYIRKKCTFNIFFSPPRLLPLQKQQAHHLLQTHVQRVEDCHSSPGQHVQKTFTKRLEENMYMYKEDYYNNDEMINYYISSPSTFISPFNGVTCPVCVCGFKASLQYLSAREVLTVKSPRPK